ncbi:ribulose phosphate epimerase [Rhizobium sp. Root1203]|uniref:L-ribulose-5-phosphate 4-epimerase AraD n=1 Tax=Rhizobium sp. Root1203 TaxID=1736427 RepID=UPI0007101AB4|nr:L-ribulose-5-phosphate 4-epimerase AraD [Rhizobium sp. Root1203]KQV23632.1 ribulose phosphate epimerase [Rhizobium sp. Root1203]
MDEEILHDVLEANRRLPREGLVSLTWGNVSGRDPKSGLVAIKPSGVSYDELQIDSLIVLDLSGAIVSGTLRPSSDTETHLELYRRFAGVNGIVHTHSPRATALCQLGLELPVLGTTHADHFDGTVPLARELTAQEIEAGYELFTGKAIADCFELSGVDPVRIPAVLQRYHAPFAWGRSVRAAMDNAVALEVCADMALAMLAAGRPLEPIPTHITRKHQDRKHGPNQTYGQTAKRSATGG